MKLANWKNPLPACKLLLTDISLKTTDTMNLYRMNVFAKLCLPRRQKQMQYRLRDLIKSSMTFSSERLHIRKIASYWWFHWLVVGPQIQSETQITIRNLQFKIFKDQSDNVFCSVSWNRKILACYSKKMCCEPKLRQMFCKRQGC